MIVGRTCPQIADEGEKAAPGDREGGTGADRRAEQQSPHRVDDRGEGLVLGKPADPSRHRVRIDQRAAGKCQELVDERETIRARRRLAYQTEHYRHPREGEGKQCDETERREPGAGIRSGPEAHEQRDPDDQSDTDHCSDQAAEDLARQYRCAEDRQGAKASNDAFIHIRTEVQRGRSPPTSHGEDEDSGYEVVDVGATVRHQALTGTNRAAEYVGEQDQDKDGDQ